MMPHCVDLMKNNNQAQNNFAANYTEIQFEPNFHSVNLWNISDIYSNCYLEHCDMTSRERNSRYISRQL
jgi:hypothetical protein